MVADHINADIRDWKIDIIKEMFIIVIMDEILKSPLVETCIMMT